MPERTEAEARAACAAAGYDPDFVGSKGFPNWQDHGGVDAETRAANAERAQAALRASLTDFPEPLSFPEERVPENKREAFNAAADHMIEAALKGPFRLPPGILVTSAGNRED